MGSSQGSEESPKSETAQSAPAASGYQASASPTATAAKAASAEPKVKEHRTERKPSAEHDFATKMQGQVAVSGRYHRPPKKLEDDYQATTKVLGSGFNGSVFLAVRKGAKDEKEKFAVKAFKLRGLAADKRADVEQECELFLSMDHPHVARLVDAYEAEDKLTLVMECMEGGELFDRVIERKRFNEKDAAEAARQMLLAINYLHSHGIVHRDIKLENWLYESHTSDHLKLIDFGFSKAWNPDIKMKMSCGTLSYVAPEVLAKSYTSQCDMWSFGVVIFIILAGYMPFSGDDHKQTRCIKEGKFTFKEEKWKDISKNARDFVEKLMVVDPKKRLTAEQALNHPWITSRDSVESKASVNEDTLRGMISFANESKFRRQCMLAMAWSLSNEERAKLRSAFMAMDTNKCGTITLQEFKSVVEENMHMEDAQIQQIFNALDAAHNGEIQYSEFLAAMVASRVNLYDDCLKTAFSRFDADASGYITFENLKQVLGENISDADLQDMMNEVDANNDGKISQQEFIDYIHASGSSAESGLSPKQEQILDQLVEDGRRAKGPSSSDDPVKRGISWKGGTTRSL